MCGTSIGEMSSCDDTLYVAHLVGVDLRLRVH